MILTSTVFVPYEYFNGHYKVESIPYDPPESFDLRSMLHGTEYDSATYNYPANGLVQKLNIPNDDMFDADTIKIDFPFSFFGYIKDYLLHICHFRTFMVRMHMVKRLDKSDNKHGRSIVFYDIWLFHV